MNKDGDPRGFVPTIAISVVLQLHKPPFIFGTEIGSYVRVQPNYFFFEFSSQTARCGCWKRVKPGMPRKCDCCLHRVAHQTKTGTM